MTHSPTYTHDAIHVLLLEDYELDAELVRHRLRTVHPDWSVDHVSCKAEYENYLQKHVPDVIISDYNIPQFTGMEAFLKMKELGLDVPFILITGDLPEETVAECVRKGIDDYIIKSSMLRLDIAIAGAIEKHKEQKQKKEIQKALRHSEERYQQIFFNAGVALVEFTSTANIREIIEARLSENAFRDEIKKCIRTLEVTAVNAEALDVFEAPDEESFINRFKALFSIPFMRYILIGFHKFSKGRNTIERILKTHTFKGHKKYFKVKTVFDPERTNSFTVSFFDMTEIKLAEQRTMKITQRLEDTVAQRMLELSELNERLRLEAEEREKINQVMRENYIAMTESIISAKRIQQLLLPNVSTIAKGFDDAFVYMRPKDIVSGDFYWYFEEDDVQWVACVDCTGHGVPGAFMSMISSKLLTQSVIEDKLDNPSEVLANIDHQVVKELKQHDAQTLISTGMDISLLRFDRRTSTVTFSGAYQNLYHKTAKGIEMIKGSRCSLGGTFKHDNKVFEQYERRFEDGDQFFMLTDGFTDQFGGPKNKKFSRRRWIDLISGLGKESLYEQEMIIKRTLQDWKGANEQVDDILVMGIRI